MIEFLGNFSNFVTSSSLSWSLIGLGGFFLINFCVVIFLFFKVKQLQRAKQDADKKLHEIVNDVKALFEVGSTLGNKIKHLEYAAKIMREEQEQLSLKEPSQQMYRNAVQLINSGESINKISESSGLARGEVELLKLFQRIDTETKNNKDALIK